MRAFHNADIGLKLIYFSLFQQEHLCRCGSIAESPRRH